MSKFQRFIRGLGPGFVTGASDDDPSGIATYAQTGAQFGYSQLWLAPLSYPFMTVVQEMCGRIGAVTGCGLAGVIKTHYARPVLYFAVTLLFLANTVNIGADLGAMASAAQLLWGMHSVFWLIIMTVTIITLQILVPYQTYSRYLKFLAFSLLAYVATAIVIRPDWGKVLQATLTPEWHWDKAYLMNIVAVLGTTISPYLFFWQASEEIEEEVAHGQMPGMGEGTPEVSLEQMADLSYDTEIGMFFSILVFFFIVVTTASTLGVHGIRDIQTATQAAQALRPLAGDFSALLFASGVIGTGFLAVPVLAGSVAYAISETFGWREGLFLSFREAKGFYGVIILSALVGVAFNFMPVAPFKMLYYTAVLNGLCAPPLLVVIMLISNNASILGAYTTNRLYNVLGWLITILMAFSGLALLWSLFQKG